SAQTLRLDWGKAHGLAADAGIEPLFRICRGSVGDWRRRERRPVVGGSTTDIHGHRLGGGGGAPISFAVDCDLGRDQRWNRCRQDWTSPSGCGGVLGGERYSCG